MSRPMATTARPETVISSTPRVTCARPVSPSVNAWIKEVPNHGGDHLGDEQDADTDRDPLLDLGWRSLDDAAGVGVVVVLTPTPAASSSERHPRSSRGVAISVGILFIAQMVTAMVRHLLDPGGCGDTGRAQVTLGVLLMTVSGLAVVAIGLLMYPVLKDVNPDLAVWYPILRIAEFGCCL